MKQRCDADRCNNQLYRRHPALAARIMNYGVIDELSRSRNRCSASVGDAAPRDENF